MTTVKQHWERPNLYQKTLDKNNNQTMDSQEGTQFPLIRKSRKGTCLNDPATFYPKTYKPLPYLANFPIIQSEGCGDMDYVMNRQNFSRRHLFPRQNPTCCQNRVRNCPSLTINITTNPGYKRQVSRSTISINPSNATVEPWVQQKVIIPQGLRCCEKRNTCEHKQPGDKKLCEFTESVEQRVIDLEGFQKSFNDEEGFVYVTRPPTISPLKTCWSFLNCKKKNKRKGEVYMPSVMTKTDFKDCLTCPKCSSTQIQEPNLLDYRERKNYFRSRLSTISESVISVSEYSSEEFMTPAERERRAREKKIHEREYPKKIYTGTGNLMETGSSQVIEPPGQIYRWVCKPADEKNKVDFGNFGTKKYICYKDVID